MGRTPTGEKRMSNAEKQNRYREKQDKEVRREKDRIRKAISHKNLKRDSVKYKNYLKQAANRWILRSKTTKETPIVNTDCPAIVKTAFPAFSRSLHKAKRSLPKETQSKQPPRKYDCFLLGRIYMNQREDGRPAVIKEDIGRPAVITEDIKEKLDSYLCRNDISFTLPGYNNQVYIGKNKQGESLFKPKKYLLLTFSELHGILNKKEDTDSSNLKFLTIYHYTRSKREYIIQKNTRSSLPMS